MGFDLKMDVPCANCVYRMRRPEDERYMFSTYWVCTRPAAERFKSAKEAAIELSADLATIDKLSENLSDPKSLEKWQKDILEDVDSMTHHLDDCREQILQGWTNPHDGLICMYQKEEEKSDGGRR